MTPVRISGPDLTTWLDEHLEELVAFRRQLHSHPELSGEEHATTEAIAERLRVAGLDSRVFRSGTGLVCDIGDAPRIALRGDIDALAMDDEKEASYASQVPGVAHACGHDVHATVTLGAGLYLAHHGFGGVHGLRLLFQPAEEQVPGGAVGVIEDGGLDGVEAVVGVHCDPKLDVGRIGLRAGAITSAADMLRIDFHGPGGHTARPEETVDMVALVGRVVTELSHRIAVRLGSETPFKLVFGSVHTGDAPNVIPSHARVGVTVRTPSTEVWSRLPAIVEEELREMASTAGAECAVEYTRGVPPVENDAALIDAIRRRATSDLGVGAVTEAFQSWGGDDFAWYGQHVPIAYVRLGTHDPASPGELFDLHAGHFDVDERAIGVGIRVMVGAFADLAGTLISTQGHRAPS